jgi:DNA-binding response OmpR family regulator
MTTILLVEDEPSLQETVAYNLRKQGYAVEATANGSVALDLVRKLKPDLILLDIMLPGMDGMEVCKVLRREKFDAPILMLTARDDEIDRVLGLELGADDYITKPFSMRELMARVKAHLRRMETIRSSGETNQSGAADQASMIFDNLKIDPSRREVILNDEILPLKPQEYDLLLFFAEHKGRMLSREHILQQVWGWDYIGDSRTVDVHVRWLRQKIEKDAANPVRIVTVRGGGYRFEG